NFLLYLMLIQLMRKDLQTLTRDQLLDYIEIISKNWLAHDGLWFQAIEKDTDIKTAMKYDVAAWRKFTVIEAKRIKSFLKLSENPGISGLVEALNYRIYANINVQETVNITEASCEFHMNKCRVQTARNRRGLPDFPCKEVGIVEYGLFASAIDSRITTECICCPPDPHPTEYYCGWRFTIEN
ncbi:MAG: DUF6125 family protein, partial [Promethearchaeota archaeon]